MPLVPARSARLFLVDDRGIVFSQEQQKLYTLNTTACFIWICLERGLDPENIAEEYSTTFSVSNDEGRTAVRQIINQWQTLGLAGYADRSPPPAGSERPVEAPVHTCHTRHEADTAWTEATYAFLGTGITIRYTSREQFLCVHPVLQHLQADLPPGSRVRQVSIQQTGGEFHLLRNGHCEGVVNSLDLLAARLKGLFIQTAINLHDYLFYFHAGVVEKHGNCILLPATAGSGKSTLTAALVAQGYNYLSDEIALLGGKDFQVVPAPIAIGLKTGSWKLLEPLYPEIPALRVNAREDGKKVRYLPPPAGARVSNDTGFPVKTIIFPRYDPASATTLRPVSRTEALHRLFNDCQAIPAALDAGHVADLADWIKSVDCYQLDMNSLDEAVGQVNRAVLNAPRTRRGQ